MQRQRMRWMRNLLASGVKAKFLNCVEKKLTAAELKELMLTCSSWHHTSSHFNKTDFYSFNETQLEYVSEQIVKSIISNRSPKPARQKDEPKLITAEVAFTAWTGTRKHPRPVDVVEVVKFHEGDKMVVTSWGNKRMTSMERITVLND